MVKKIIEETAYGIQEKYNIEMKALGMDKNHIHFLSSAHLKVVHFSSKIWCTFHLIFTQTQEKSFLAVQGLLQKNIVWLPGYFVSIIGLDEKSKLEYAKFQQIQVLDLVKIELF